MVTPLMEELRSSVMDLGGIVVNFFINRVKIELINQFGLTFRDQFGVGYPESRNMREEAWRLVCETTFARIAVADMQEEDSPTLSWRYDV